MIVTLRQMQYIVAVAKLGSFSKAADACAADQSTVSHQIKTFEERLGVQVFDRTTLPISITEEGKSIIEQCEKVIAEVEKLVIPYKKGN